MEWKKKASPHWWDSWHRIVCNTDSPIHIHKVITQEVSKAFNVGINAWNITAVLYSNGDWTRWLLPFSWRFWLIHLKVYEMSQACYLLWFNWRNSITCTHDNVLSLGHNSIQQREWKKIASPHQWDSWHCNVCNTDSPIHIHKFIPQEASKAFNVRFNAWNITAVLYSNGDRTSWFSLFSWRFFLIHLEVCEVLQACYCCWFNWKNSITCTHCNVTSLEYDSIPWQAKSQRIKVHATTFHLLWQLFMIIKMFSSKFELDWKNWLPKTNQIWTVYVLWAC